MIYQPETTHTIEGAEYAMINGKWKRWWPSEGKWTISANNLEWLNSRLRPIKSNDCKINAIDSIGSIEQNQKTASDILVECISVQAERGKDYDTDESKKERSFGAASVAFNAITGKNITPAEVCLMLQVLKDVRQWSQDRLHEDSVLDGVSYASLKGEELYKQYGENK